MRLWLGLLLAVLVAAPTQAARLDRAQRIAEKVWHKPCAGQVTLAFEREDLGFEYDGISGTAWASRTRCLIEFSVEASDLPWAELCHIVIHEYGHLAGAEHNYNPRSVMYESLDISIGRRVSDGKVWVEGVDPRCYDRGRRYLGMRPTNQGWR